MNIAILITTYKRKNETLKCLKSIKCEYEIDIFISDSNSKNGLSKDLKAKKNIFIDNVGNNIYWNRGTNFSWNKASNFKKYDFYIWLNNDTYLINEAIKTILNDYYYLKNTRVIITGVTEYKNKLTYGGRNKLRGDIIPPSGKPKKIKYMNGNFVLIPKIVFEELGYLHTRYQHSLGDIDYGLRALKKGIKLFCSSKIIGICKSNPSIWYREQTLKKRYDALISPKGTPINEYFYFNYKHFGFLKAIKFLLVTSIALVAPNFYMKLLKR